MALVYLYARNNSRAGVTCRLVSFNVLLCRIIFYSDIKISLWFYCACVPPSPSHHCINSLAQKLISGAVCGMPGYKLQDLIFSCELLEKHTK